MTASPSPEPAGRVLVAGIGNIFLGDDGFGVEVVQRLARHPLPEHAQALDIGVRGVHLAYQVLDGCETLIMVDAVQRGGAPGTVRLIEVSEQDRAAPEGVPVVDGHHMSPQAVLALLETLREGMGGSTPGRVFVVGCEPAELAEGIGLSPPVAAAVDEAVELVLRLLADAPAHPSPDEAADAAPDGAAERRTAARDSGVAAKGRPSAPL
ncbi:hydrogenase maturation protease [Streptomyces smyrnaeus]|uniref:hydrogenase maturation protease n=1 Tax=Streptomyces TaxID=1883 RepID=UPI000C1A171F|nr:MULTISPECIES: hydrogenase maturation protease [unclassified Streptomyces]MBQ0862515.1 hydrogenase maturation protease [Streptomyces sp. RK75]MBQ1125351.1 hydrogenase maturation protease [Streptomyces sp. B15]